MAANAVNRTLLATSLCHKSYIRFGQPFRRLLARMCFTAMYIVLDVQPIGGRRLYQGGHGQYSC
jgi:hypothetical protein